MDTERFDGWVRALTTARTRRSALVSLVGGGLGLVGFAAAEAKKHKKKKKKRGNVPPPASPPPASPPTAICVPDPPSATCAGRCGFWNNNCGQSVSCLACPGSTQCLSNGSCAQACQMIGGPPCPGDCGCSFPTPEGTSHCIETLTTSCPTETCRTTADCRPGFQCSACNEVLTCLPLCSA